MVIYFRGQQAGIDDKYQNNETERRKRMTGTSVAQAAGLFPGSAGMNVAGMQNGNQGDDTESRA